MRISDWSSDVCSSDLSPSAKSGTSALGPRLRGDDGQDKASRRTIAGVSMTHPVLTALGLSDNESGTYLGNGEWSKTRDAGVLEPVNPADGEVIAKVQASSQADYDTIVERAQAAFKVWRTTPAPRRGEAVRLCAD